MMMEKKIELTVVIPAYLEEENLRILLPRLRKVLKLHSIDHNVLVVDTFNPMDETNLVCKELGADYVNRENSNDYGDAVRTGISRALGKYTLFMDGDGSHTPEFVPKMMEFAGNNDIVIASRYVQGGSTDNSPILILMSRIVNIMYALILGIRCKDISNSFKLYRTDLIKPLKLKSRNFDIIEEILYKLSKINRSLKIVEIPYSFKERMFGHTKRNLFAFMFSYFITLMKLRLRG